MNREVVIPKQLFDDIVLSLEWVLEQPEVFECDCEPVYEDDTNVWNHKEGDNGCAIWMEDHIDIALRELKECAETGAEYVDGKPTNLEAAASDALDWLKFWRNFLRQAPHLNNEKWNDARRRLTGAIEALQTFLPKREPVFNETPTIRYNAVAVIEISSFSKEVQESDE